VDLPEISYTRSVGDIDIAYSEFGREDGPRLVCVAGFVSHLELNWESPVASGIVGPLADACRILCFDKRGTGLSGRDLGFGSIAERTDDARAVMDACGWDDAHVLGISEGGPMAILLAATYPDRVTSLSLYGTFARTVGTDGDASDIHPGDIKAWLDHLEGNWGTGLVLADPFIAHADEYPLEARARFERNACTPKMVREIMTRNLEIDVRDVLPTLSVPTLVVHSVGDPLVNVSSGRYLAEHIDGARYVELPFAMHGTARVRDYEGLIDAVIEHVHGKRDRVVTERALATVLFTDIVDSTQIAARVGDREWRRLLDRHDEETRRCVERFGGNVVKQTGDGMLSTFDGPARGVQCAKQLGDALVPYGIAIRAGLHTGEVERRGDDVGGIGVHIGARVAALARGGEVYVSRTVRDLVVGSELRFEDRGTHELKGVPDSWQLYAAV